MIPRAPTGQCTAIIGSGPAGLGCAYFLAVLGRRAVIFESNTVVGGLLSTGIPEFRLPRDTLALRIGNIVDRQEIRLGIRIERLEDLVAAGYGAVFIGTGAQASRMLGVPGEDLDGVTDALQYLGSYCRGASDPSARGEKVAVIGGGHTAFDAARAAKRDGAESVTVYYRRSLEELGAYQDEVEAAIAEGVRITRLCVPVAIDGTGRSMQSLRLARTELSAPDEEGRRTAIARPEDEFCVTATLLIRAIGQELPDQSLYGDLERSPWGGLRVSMETGATEKRGVFAGGDCVLGASSVLRAIDSGRRAALAIDRYYGGAGLLPPHEDFSIPRPFGLFNP